MQKLINWHLLAIASLLTLLIRPLNGAGALAYLVGLALGACSLVLALQHKNPGSAPRPLPPLLLLLLLTNLLLCLIWTPIFILTWPLFSVALDQRRDWLYGTGSFVAAAFLCWHAPTLSFSRLGLFFHHPPLSGGSLSLLQVASTGLLLILGLVLAAQSSRAETLKHELLRHEDDWVSRAKGLESERAALLERRELERERAILSERNRIARDIHDNVGHQLSGAILLAGALELQADESLKPGLLTLRSQLNKAMENIRSSVHAIHEDSLHIQAALEKLAETGGPLTIEVKADIAHEPSPDIYYCLMAIAREALANCARHSNATRVELSLSELGDYYHFLIIDNGTKPSDQEKDQSENAQPRRSASSGLGLVSLNERVERLGGSFRVSGENGWRLFARIPREITNN